MLSLSRLALAPARALAPALALALLAAAPAVAAPLPSALSAQPSSLDFGVVPADRGGYTIEVWVQNPGPDPLQLASSTTAGSSAFRVNWDGCSGNTVTGGDSCSVGVSFEPDDGAEHSGTLHVPALGFDDLQVPLSGTGGVQQVTLEPSTLDFGDVGVGDSAVRTFKLTSVGTLLFSAFVTVPSGGDVGAFRVEHDGCTLQPIATGVPCPVSVRFTPLAPGPASATLLLIGGDSDPAIVPLRGSGSAAVPAAAAEAAAAAAPPVAPAGTTKRLRRAAADLIFGVADGLPARFSRGRIALGAVRCAGAPRCTVVVRSRVFALAGRGTVRAAGGRARMTSASGGVALWRLRSTERTVRLAIPRGLRGRPSLLVARLRVRAPGHRTTTRVHVVPLVGRQPLR